MLAECGGHYSGSVRLASACLCVSLSLTPAFARAAEAQARAVVLPDALEVGPLAATAKELYFVGIRIGETPRLWQSHGAPDTTHPVWTEDGEELAFPRHLATSSSWMYFAASAVDAVEREQDWLYRSNGTLVQLLARVPVARAFAGEGRLFFTVVHDDGEHLWQTDGEATTDTRVVLPLGAAALAYGNSLLFAGSGESGVEPWQTDGSPETTRELADLVPGAGGSHPGVFARVGESATFFSLSDPTALWRTEGGAMRSVATFAHGSATEPSVANAYGFDRRVYFRARAGEGAWSMWASDGTASGTLELAALGADPLESPMLGAGADLYFTADHGGAPALYATRGTPASTRRIATGVVSALSARADRVYFALDADRLGGSDGTEAGTAFRQLPREAGSWPAYGVFDTVGSVLYFSTRLPDHSTRLWALDLPEPATPVVAEPAHDADPVSSAEEGEKDGEGCDCKPGSIFSPFSGLFAFAFLRRPGPRPRRRGVD